MFFCRANSFYTMAVYTEACVESQSTGICGLKGIKKVLWIVDSTQLEHVRSVIKYKQCCYSG